MANRYAVLFRTNLDGYQNEKWPDDLMSNYLPRTGEYIKSQSSGRCLKVVGVTHSEYLDDNMNATHQIEIELGKD